LTTSYQEFTFYFIGTGNYDLFIHRKFGQTAGQNQQILISNVTVKEVIDTNNIPRISYDSNGDNGHILLEPTSTNLITYSEAFENWNNQNIDISTNQAISPNGILNATKLQPTQTSGIHILTIAETSSNVKTYSVFAKQNGYKRFRFNTGSSGNGFASFDLNTGSVASTGGTYYSSSNIEDYGNGWYRCSITFLANAPNVYTIVVEDNTGQIVFPGDGVSSIYVWGAQVEELSYATSYIPSLTGSTETRATETATGAGSADLINSTEGVLYAEIAGLVDDLSFRTISISDGTTSNRCVLRYGGTTNYINVLIFSGGSTVFDNNYTLSDITDFSKIAVKWKVNDFALWVDGVERKTDTSGSAPIGLSQLQLSNYDNSSNNFYGKCKALAVFNEALSDSELTQLTT